MTDLLRGTDHCPICFQPCPPHGTWWTLLSRHPTSEGDIKYCTSLCGCLVVLLGDQILKATPANRHRSGRPSSGAERLGGAA